MICLAKGARATVPTGMHAAARAPRRSLGYTPSLEKTLEVFEHLHIAALLLLRKNQMVMIG